MSKRRAAVFVVRVVEHVMFDDTSVTTTSKGTDLNNFFVVGKGHYISVNDLIVVEQTELPVDGWNAAQNGELYYWRLVTDEEAS